MALFLKLILYVHIAGGTLCLITGLITLLSKKGASKHRFYGKLFYMGMCIVFLSTLLLALFKEHLFLLMIAVFSFYMASRGYRSLYLKDKEARDVKLIDWILSISAGIFHLGLLIFGIILIALQGKTFGVVPIIFGSIGSSMVIADIRRYSTKLYNSRVRLSGHIAGMVGAYIATVTAFLVVNVKFEPAWVLWLLPTLVLTPLIIYNIRKYAPKKRL